MLQTQCNPLHSKNRSIDFKSTQTSYIIDPMGSNSMTDRLPVHQRSLQYPLYINQNVRECVDRKVEAINEKRDSFSGVPSEQFVEPSYKTSGSSDIPPIDREQLPTQSAQSLSDFSLHQSTVPHHNIELKHEYGVSQQEPWEHCRRLAFDHDSDMCSAWKAELDNLLIFAGLFSAAVTAFTIDSYKWLLQDSTQYNAQVLALIYKELNPATGAEKLSSISNLLPQGLVVRINIYWFLSLTLGLTTVLIGIIVSQWLREYQRGIPLPSQGKLSVRQMRFDGLVFWQVPRIISFLPLFLQLGFVLFLVGILELLWYINMVVAIAITIPLGLVFLFLVLTIALPTIQYVFLAGEDLRSPQCPYKSPQALGILRFVIFLSTLLPRGWKKILGTRPNLERLFNSSYSWSWQHFDAVWRKSRETFSATRSPVDIQGPYDIVRSLTWLVETFDETSENILSILQCLQQMPVCSAVQVLTKAWVDLDTRKLEDICNLLENNMFTTKTAQDVITAVFLHGYQRSHPALRILYWTSHIRLMRNKSVPRNLIDWYGTDVSYNDIGPGLQLPLLKSLNGLIETDAASTLDIQYVWQTVYTILNPEFFEMDSGSESHIEYCFKLFESFEAWLSRPPKNDPDRPNKALLSMDGVLMLVHHGFFEKWGSHPDYGKFLSFVRKLNFIMKGLPGGPLSLLPLANNPTYMKMEDIWPTYMSWIFQEA